MKTAAKRPPKTPNDGASITRARILAMGDRLLYLDREMGAVMFWHILRGGGNYDGHKFEGIENMAKKASSTEGGLGTE